MSFSFGVIDAHGDFGSSALAKDPAAKALFGDAAEQLKRSFSYIDASFGDGRLDVSDYVRPLWSACGNAALEVPLLNSEIRGIRKQAEASICDIRIRAVVLSFLCCAEQAGLDVVFSG